MRQRLALAAALLGDSETLVLDEPATVMDPAGVLWLRTLVRTLAADGRTVLISSHVFAELAHTVSWTVITRRSRSFNKAFLPRFAAN